MRKPLDSAAKRGIAATARAGKRYSSEHGRRGEQAGGSKHTSGLRPRGRRRVWLQTCKARTKDKGTRQGREVRGRRRVRLQTCKARRKTGHGKGASKHTPGGETEGQKRGVGCKQATRARRDKTGQGSKKAQCIQSWGLWPLRMRRAALRRDG